MARHIKVISHYWKDIVWSDVLAFHPDSDNVGFDELERQFHELQRRDDEPWPALRDTYFRLSRFYNAVGFADSILHAIDALAENRDLDISRLWIVDEFQDFNVAEDALINALFAEAYAHLLAGDDDQALYQELKASHPEIIRTAYAK